MQTYTHLLAGLVIGRLMYPHEDTAQAACATGSIIPDLIMVPKFALDKLTGRAPLKEQSFGLMATKEMSHSLCMWMICLYLGYLIPHAPAFPFQTFYGHCLIALSVGGLAHILADILSHGDLQFAKYDCDYLWPTSYSLYGLAVWDYRKETGDITPKYAECAILDMLLTYYAALWVIW